MKATLFILLMVGIAFGYKCPDIPIPVFPKSSAWNWNISKVDVHSKSADYIESIGATESLRPWFGTSKGIPYSIVEGAKTVNVEFTGRPEDSDSGPYRIPLDAPKESGNDSRVIVIDKNNHMLYELYKGDSENPGYPDSWQASSGAIFDLNTSSLRKAGAYSADPSGMAILPGLARYQDITNGKMEHAVRAVIQYVDNRYVYPARNSPAKSNFPKLPAMGQRFRLKKDVDITKLGVQAQIVADGLKKYGFIVADRGYSPYMYGTKDERWSDADIATLENIMISDFEALVEMNLASAAALDPFETVKTYGSPFKSGKGKLGLLNLPAGKLTIKINDSNNVLVKELDTKTPAVFWDLKDISGKSVSAGKYIVRLEDNKNNTKEIAVNIE